MMKSISGAISKTLWAKGIIQKQDIDTCRYGLEVFASSVLEIASILIIAIFIGNFFETLSLFIMFIPLRIYAGGYHADTKIKCYLISLGVYVLLTLVITITPKAMFPMLNTYLTVITCVTVLTLSPVIHKNKTVSNKEKRHYRNISIFICLTETLIIVLLTAFSPRSSAVVSMAIGQAAVAFSMIGAALKGKISANK